MICNVCGGHFNEFSKHHAVLHIIEYNGVEYDDEKDEEKKFEKREKTTILCPLCLYELNKSIR